MSEYRFTPAERWAVFSVHGGNCYICRQPIDFKSMHVDHVIPERLLADPQELARIFKELRRPATFDLNSYENWLPACGPCNRLKSGTPFDPAPIVLLALQRAADKADEARADAQRTLSSKAIGNAIATVQRAVVAGDMSEDDVTIMALLFVEHHPDVVKIMQRAQARKGGMSRGHMGLMVPPYVLLQLRLTPFATVEYFSDGSATLANDAASPL